MIAHNGDEQPGVIGYVRVSTTEQSEKGVSLDAQRRRLRGYCEAHGLTLLRIEEDAGISAKTVRRPGLQRALAAMSKGEATGIVALKLDRLSRSTRDVLDLVARAEKEGWALHSIDERLDTGSPHGRFVVTILAALSQMEREQVSARTKIAMAELRRQGRKTGSKPRFGFAYVDGLLVPNDEEIPILQRILELRDAGCGAYKIMTTLNAEGTVNPRTRDVWRLGTMQSILRTVERDETSAFQSH